MRTHCRVDGERSVGQYFTSGSQQQLCQAGGGFGEPDGRESLEFPERRGFA